MNTKPIKNILFSSPSNAPARFRWWKRIATATLLTLFFVTLANMNIAMHPERANPSGVNLMFWLYVLSCIVVLVLPAFAPKEIRFIGSDISMLGKAVLQKKAPIHRLFWALSIEKEAETMLDERETSQRHKAITFAYKVYPGFLGMMLGHLFFAQHPVNNIAIIYFIVFGLAVHAVIPAAYLVWNYKPLETEFET